MPRPLYYIGLMSGTSVDAIDAVIVDCFSSPPKLIATHKESIPLALKDRIIKLFEPGNNEIDRLGELDREIAELSAKATLEILRSSSMRADQICAIGSHGQTIRHRPELKHAFSLQIGDPNTIAELTGITVVADFRRRDIAAGGQGAPLVAAFHQACFHSTRTQRCIVNIGGIANITVLNPKKLIGFDSGPGNGLMDFWARKQLGLEYDNKGHWAQSGTLNKALLNQWLSHPYFTKPFPKSTGKEEFSNTWLMQSLNQTNIEPQDIQRTLLELTVLSLTDAILHCCPQAEIYVCGGGSHNTYLVDRLAQCLNTPVATTTQLNWHPDWVEASAFAWLSHQRMEQLAANIPSVTGATEERVLGGIFSA